MGASNAHGPPMDECGKSLATLTTSCMTWRNLL